MDKRRVFTHIISNVILAIVVLSVAAVSFMGATANVFKNDDYSPIYRGNGVKQVSLLINVYWGEEYLDEMLAILDKYNVNVTFFFGGCWVAKYPEKLAKVAALGHEIGNHGYYHKEHGKLTYEQNVAEITSCSKLIFEYIGVSPTLFAPPGGDFSTDTLKAAYDNGHRTIMWSRDTIDWRDKNADTVYTRATKDTADGEFILMHPTKHTLEALEKIVKYYIDNGVSIVPVSKNLGELWTSTNNTKAD